MQQIIENISEELFKSIEKSKSIKIICPFIKEEIAKKIVSKKGKDIMIITRYKLSDCYDGVSDLLSLRHFLRMDCQVKGVKDLHAKLYIFDNRVIISSANLTENGIYKNHEISIMCDDDKIIQDCIKYFDNLWKDAGEELKQAKLIKWINELNSYSEKNPPSKSSKNNLPDYGSKIKSKKHMEKMKSNNNFTYYYFNFESNEHRRWEDALKFGFIAAGYGEYYSKYLKKLRKGDKVFVYLLRNDNGNNIALGYAGYCIVMEESKPVRELTFIDKSKLIASEFYHDKDNLKKCEHVVRVKWITKRGFNDKIELFKGGFFYRGILCRMFNDRKKVIFTLNELRKRKFLP